MLTRLIEKKRINEIKYNGFPLPSNYSFNIKNNMVEYLFQIDGVENQEKDMMLVISFDGGKSHVIGNKGISCHLSIQFKLKGESFQKTNYGKPLQTVKNVVGLLVKFLDTDIFKIMEDEFNFIIVEGISYVPASEDDDGGRRREALYKSIINAYTSTYGIEVTSSVEDKRHFITFQHPMIKWSSGKTEVIEKSEIDNYKYSLSDEENNHLMSFIHKIHSKTKLPKDEIFNIVKSDISVNGMKDYFLKSLLQTDFNNLDIKYNPNEMEILKLSVDITKGKELTMMGEEYNNVSINFKIFNSNINNVDNVSLDEIENTHLSNIIECDITKIKKSEINNINLLNSYSITDSKVSNTNLIDNSTYLSDNVFNNCDIPNRFNMKDNNIVK